jgi:hypothetical protein
MIDNNNIINGTYLKSVEYTNKYSASLDTIFKIQSSYLFLHTSDRVNPDIA